MIEIKDSYIYAVLIEKKQGKFNFRIVFLEEECTDKEDLMVVLSGLSVNCYGKDIKKAKELLIKDLEEQLKNQNTLLCELKLKEEII